MSYTTITVTIDKPTRDELIELLSSSKFTAGTWEQFVCYLPNMTQEIITDIKGSSGDFMIAVAQHCINQNPDMTWKTIMMSLLHANEIVLTCQVLTDMECSCSVNKG